MRIVDAAQLAYTKLRTRKIRTVVCVFVAGLLFALLATLSLVTRGMFASVGSFTNEGLGSRYVANAQYMTNLYIVAEPEVVARAKVLEKEYLIKRIAEAKKLGIEYDVKSEPPAVMSQEGPDGKIDALSPDHPVAKQAVEEYLAKHPLPDKAFVKKYAEKYGVKDVYESQLPFGVGGSGPNGKLKILKNGKETFETADKMSPPFEQGINSFAGGWALLGKGLLQPFLLPGQTLDIGADKSIPILVPFSAAEELAGEKPLPANTEAALKLARLKTVRSKAAGAKFQVCYRNITSENQIQQLQAAQADMEANKSDKNYQKPSLIYGLPDTACGQPIVVQDKRTKTEKDDAAKQLAFAQAFGTEPASSEIVTYRVVGVMADQPSSASSTIANIVSTIVMTNLGPYWYTPYELKESQPVMKKYFAVNPAQFLPQQSFFPEFNSADGLRQFLDKENCVPSNSRDPAAACSAKKKYFYITPYGSSSLALEQAGKYFSKFFRIAALVVSVIGALIMLGTIGRIIADSRRETAVFRAIGAKRLDINQIYITYTLYLSSFVFVFAVTVGFILARIADQRWSTEATNAALIAYNASDLTKRFRFYSFNLSDMLFLAGVTIAVGLLAASVPLIRNARRNPIKDMRDE